MGGCFGSHPIDRWLESQVDNYTDPLPRRLTPDERRAMEKYDLTEDEIREGYFVKTETYKTDNV